MERSRQPWWWRTLKAVVESDSVGPSPMVTEVGHYAQSSRPDGQLSQHL